MLVIDKAILSDSRTILDAVPSTCAKADRAVVVTRNSQTVLAPGAISPAADDLAGLSAHAGCLDVVSGAADLRSVAQKCQSPWRGQAHFVVEADAVQFNPKLSYLTQVAWCVSASQVCGARSSRRTEVPRPGSDSMMMCPPAWCTAVLTLNRPSP